MQEEIDQKTISLSCKTGKFTASELKKLLTLLLKHLSNHKKAKSAGKQNSSIKHGKQKLQTLQEQNRELTNIEITDENIKSFEKCAKKYNVDYALMADKTQSPPRWYVFFKAQDTSLMKAAFKEYTNDTVVRKKPSVRKKLDNTKKKARAHKAQQRQRERDKNRSGQSL